MVVIRDLSGGVTTFSVPFLRGGVLPIGGRSTAFKRDDGSLFFVASHPLCEETKQKITSLGGKLSHIVALDSVHTLYIESYHKAYPDAKVLGVEPNVAKLTNVKFSGVWGKDEDPLGLTGANEFKAVYFDSFANKDVVILHEPSKTIVEADLLYNLPDPDQSKPGWFANMFVKQFTPYTGFHRRVVSSLASDKKAFGASAKAVDAWDFTRIVPCHGSVVEGDGKAKEAWRSTFRQFL